MAKKVALMCASFCTYQRVICPINCLITPHFYLVSIELVDHQLIFYVTFVGLYPQITICHYPLCCVPDLVKREITTFFVFPGKSVENQRRLHYNVNFLFIS